MTAIVPVASPTNKRSTHHLVLESGAIKLGLILCDSEGNEFSRAFHRRPMPSSSLKMSTGLQRYSDMMPPWTPVSQENWEGGKGAKDIEKDETMFYDSEKINTTKAGEIILAGKPTEIGFGNVTMTNTDAGSIDHVHQGSRYYAWKFTASASFTPTIVTIIDCLTLAALRIGICAATAGHPDITTVTWSTETQTLTGSFGTVVFTLSKALTSGTIYYLVFAITGPSGALVEFHQGSAAANDTWYSADSGASWGALTASVCPYFLMETVTDKLGRAHFFKYKGALYGIKRNDDGTANKLFLNGDHGVGVAGSTVSSVVFGGYVTHTLNDAVGSIMKIVSGLGSDQPQNWRIITGNSATSAGKATYTFLTAFDVAPDATSVILIQASNIWTEIVEFDNNFNVSVTDVLVAHGAVYFACGDATAMIRWTAYNNAGAWTFEWSSIGGKAAETGQFCFLTTGSDLEGEFIIGGKGGYPSQTQRAPAVDWSAGTGAAVLAWETAIGCGDLYERITGLTRYGSSGSPLALKEGGTLFYNDKKWYQMSNPALSASADSRTGRAFCVQEPYLYFSYDNTIVRYFNEYLDGVGPDKAEVSIPTGNRYGNFTSLVVYPGLVIGSVDAGSNGYSTVLAYNERGWCEFYRAALGYRIQEIFVQAIEGQAVDRLWISEGSKFIWIPLSPDPVNHPSDGYNPYVFCTDGSLITAWNYLGLHGVDKLFNAIRLVGENLSAACYVTVSYQVDEPATPTTWTTLATKITTFSQELDLAATPSVSGKRIRFKFDLHSNTGLISPRVIATVLEALAVYPVKYITDIRFRIGDKDVDLNKKPDKYQDHDLKLNDLETLMAAAVPPLVTSVSTQLNNKYCRIDSINIDPQKIETETGEEVYIGTATLVEVS